MGQSVASCGYFQERILRVAALYSPAYDRRRLRRIRPAPLWQKKECNDVDDSIRPAFE
jgi:hypothetical protein